MTLFMIDPHAASSAVAIRQEESVSCIVPTRGSRIDFEQSNRVPRCAKADSIIPHFVCNATLNPAHPQQESANSQTYMAVAAFDHKQSC
jgi:hypothetical protein